MKTTKKMMVGILALALVFVFIGCGGDDAGGGSGSNFNIPGLQVYQMNGILITEYSGNLEVKSNVGGSGSITEGKLTFSISTPNRLEPLTTVMTSGDIGNILNGFSFSPTETQGAALYLTTGAGDLTKVKMSIGNSLSADIVYYAYVDRNCSISGEGRTASIRGYTVTYKDTNLNLKSGWNAITAKVVSTSILSRAGTATFSVSDPSSCNWTLNFSIPN